MGRFKGMGGVRVNKELTKSELQQKYDNQLQALGNALQQLQTGIYQNLIQMSNRLANIEKRLEAVDYRSVATRDLAIKGGLYTDEAHINRARELRIEDFNKQSAEDDQRRKLMPVDGTAELGHWMTFSVGARYPETLVVPSIKDKTEVSLQSADGTQTDTVPTLETVPHPQAGQKIEGLSSLRSKIKIGAGNLMPELEQRLVGLKSGETKDITLCMPQGYGEFAGKDVVFTVEVLDLKREAEQTQLVTEQQDAEKV